MITRVSSIPAMTWPSWEDVEDPAGGDLPIFRACAHAISDLIDQLVPELEAGVTPDEEIA